VFPFRYELYLCVPYGSHSKQRHYMTVHDTERGDIGLVLALSRHSSRMLKLQSGWPVSMQRLESWASETEATRLQRKRDRILSDSSSSNVNVVPCSWK
jgi:hypothetical protein